MAKLVIQTQYMENYDVDQTTEEGHWKYKGGHDYVINDVDVNNYYSMVNELLPLIEYDNSMSREYVIDWEITLQDGRRLWKKHEQSINEFK